jgi:hypothetical protein
MLIKLLGGPKGGETISVREAPPYLYFPWEPSIPKVEVWKTEDFIPIEFRICEYKRIEPFHYEFRGYR